VAWRKRETLLITAEAQDYIIKKRERERERRSAIPFTSNEKAKSPKRM
jgi:hypothetical protein